MNEKWHLTYRHPAKHSPYFFDINKHVFHAYGNIIQKTYYLDKKQGLV